MSTPLTLYGSLTASSTLPLANTFIANTTGGSTSSTDTKIGTATGYGQVYAQGATAAWPALGSLGSPDGHGVLFDVTTLEGQTILAGNWTPTLRFHTSTGSIVADIYVRIYVFDGLNFSQIGTNLLLSGQTINTSVANYTFAATALPARSFHVDEKLYVGVWLNITANSTGSSSATIKFAQSTSTTQGSPNFQIVTPGYQVATTASKSAPLRIRVATPVLATRSAAVRTKVRTQAVPTTTLRLNVRETSMAIMIGGRLVTFDEDSFKLSPKLDERWRCQFTVLDYVGNLSFPIGEEVVIRDDTRGTLFSGFVVDDKQDRSNMYPHPATEHQIDCVDNRRRADKRTSNRLYSSPTYAGKIVVDLVDDVLADEGVIAPHVTAVTTTTADWATGTLAGTVATSSLLDGDLELASSASLSASYLAQSDWTTGGTFQGTTSHADGSLSLIGVARLWNNGVFSQQTLYGITDPSEVRSITQGITSGRYYLTCPANDESHVRFDFAGTWKNGTIEVDMNLAKDGLISCLTYRSTRWSQNNETYAYAVELTTTTIKLKRGSNGGIANAATTLASKTFGSKLGTGWYRVRVVVSGSSHTISHNGKQDLSVSDSAYTAAGSIGLRNRNPSSCATKELYDNFGVLAVLSGTWISAATDLSGVSSVVSSHISWDASASTGGTVTVAASTDGGTTYQSCSNGGIIPGLAPGASGTGLSLVIKVTLATASTVLLPKIRTLAWSVVGGFASSGTRISAGLDLSPVGRAGASFISWNEMVPEASGGMEMDVSLDGGVTWTDISDQNGQPLPGIFTQPDPTVDSFDGTSPATYMSTAAPGAPSALPAPPAPLTQDTFTRANQSGWGTASNGETWAHPTGPDPLSISSNAGVVSGAVGVQNVMLLGSQTARNATALVRLSHDSSLNDWTGLVLRASSDGTSAGYHCAVIGAGVGGLRMWRENSGIHTQLTNLGLTLPTGTYWLRFTIASPFADGTNPMLFARTWQDGTAEPTSWQLIYTDTDGAQISAVGAFGIYAWGDNGASVMKFDSFSVHTLPVPTPNPYAASVDSSATPNFAGNAYSNQNMTSALLDSGATATRYAIEWWGIERAVQTTSATAVASAGSHTITLASVPANFIVGAQVLVDTALSNLQETVTITAQSGSTITATFANGHLVNFPVAIIPQAGDTPASSGSPARVQPYDWSIVDDYVATAQASGLNIIFVLLNAPVWHSVQLACSSNPDKTVANSADVPAFLTVLLTRYPSGTFYSIEAANEGYNNPSNICPDMFTTQMFPLLSTVRSLVNSNSPGMLVGAPALIDNGTGDASAWFTDFYAAGCARFVDYLNVHYYNDIYGPNQPQAGDDSFSRIVAAIHAVQAANADTARPIWVTEFGWNLNLVPNATMATYITQLLTDAHTSGDVQKVIFYNIGQIAPGSGASQDFTGAAYQAWKGFISGRPSWTPALPATWIIEAANSRLIASGGSTAFYLNSEIAQTDVDLFCDMDQADMGGLVWDVVDTDDYYSAVVTDNVASAGTPNRLTLYKTVAGVQTQLAQTHITFTRGIHYRLRASSASGVISVSFDGAQSLTYTDPSPLGAGLMGLYQSGNASRYSQVWLQPLGDDLSGVTLTTRQTLSTSDSSVTPQVEDLTVVVFSPSIDLGTLIPSADYRSTFIDKNYDDLAKQSNYSWFIDPDRLLHFHHRQAYPAPWILQSNTIGLASDLEIDTNLLLEQAADLYRNRQVLKGVTNTGLFQDAFAGDGKRTSFTLSYPVAPGTIPVITLNSTAQKAGKKGATGSQWYYAEGDATIGEDNSGTVLVSTDTLVISYTGIFSDTVTADNTDAQAALKTREGGTGIVEAVEDVSQKNMTYAAGLVYAQQLLERYCVLDLANLPTGRTYTFTTRRDGLAIGQVISVFVPEQGLSDVQMLITAIDMTVQTQPNRTVVYEYLVTISELPVTASWAKLFANNLFQ